MSTPTTAPAPEPAFGHEEFARRVGMSVWWVKHNMPTIQHVRIGSRVRFTQTDVEAFLASRRVVPGIDGHPVSIPATPTKRRARRSRTGGQT